MPLKSSIWQEWGDYMPIEFEGLEGILKRFNNIKNAEGIKQGLEKGCLAVERSAKQHAPKGNGALARSITSKVEDFTGIVSTPLFYAPYVEYGTGLFATGESGGRKDVPWVYRDDKTGDFYTTYGQHPQPYMRPALDENRDNIIEYIREGLIDD